MLILDKCICPARVRDTGAAPQAAEGERAVPRPPSPTIAQERLGVVLLEFLLPVARSESAGTIAEGHTILEHLQVTLTHGL